VRRSRRIGGWVLVLLVGGGVLAFEGGGDPWEEPSSMSIGQGGPACALGEGGDEGAPEWGDPVVGRVSPKSPNWMGKVGEREPCWLAGPA